MAIQSYYSADDTLAAIQSFIGYTNQWDPIVGGGSSASAQHSETGQTLEVEFDDGVATVSGPGVSNEECESEDDLRTVAGEISDAL